MTCVYAKFVVLLHHQIENYMIRVIKDNYTGRMAVRKLLICPYCLSELEYTDGDVKFRTDPDGEVSGEIQCPLCETRTVVV